MSDCEHVFDRHDDSVFTESYNAGHDRHRELPPRLKVDMECTKCGEDVTVIYDLHYIGDEVVTQEDMQ